MMQYLCIDFGGSSLKYSLMNSEDEFIDKGMLSLDDVKTVSGMVDVIRKLYDRYERPDGGIAISYCGELDPEKGCLLNGGSYPFMAGCNLKEETEKACNTRVSIENDGNCAAIAELHKGSLKGCRNAFALIIGTGIAGAVIINGSLYHGSHNYSGLMSFCTADISRQFSLDNIAAKQTSANYLGCSYTKEVELEEKINGKQFFDYLKNNDQTAKEVLDKYTVALANVIYNVQLLLDVERITIGGGISVEPLFQQELKESYDRIYDITPLQYIKPPKAELVFCKYHNDANMLGALLHHKEMGGIEA